MKFEGQHLLLILLISLNVCARQVDSLRINLNYINTSPQNAEVYLNKNYIGSTPVRFPDNVIDQTGNNEILIKLKNYYDYSFTIDLSGLPINKDIVLVPINKSIGKDIVFKDASNSFKPKRKVFPIALSAAVAASSAVFSFYFKSLANDNYDEYLNTGDRNKLDRTKKYDLYSGVALVILQVSFVSFLYFLLLE